MKKEFKPYIGGLSWLYTNSKGDELSIICHTGSYGWSDGLFETRCSWKDDVQGFLTFEDVNNTIIELRELERV